MNVRTFFAFLAVLFAADIRAATYTVGDGKQFAHPDLVPWQSLKAGDTVFIHWRATPYKSKWNISGQGSASTPIAVRGVVGPYGQLPIIDGDQAVAPSGMRYVNESRSVVKIGAFSYSGALPPMHIVVENLDIRNGRSPLRFTGYSGGLRMYAANAAAVHVESGQFITLRNVRFTSSGNGLFITYGAKDIVIENSYFANNGNIGSTNEHNAYTSATGITFQGNRFESLRSGALGNNLKDRSVGLVVRYNSIYGGNRQLDLVDNQQPLAYTDSRYSQTVVYGNVLIEPAGAGNRQMIHYGGDSGQTNAYRKGTLFFYNNTVISERRDATTIFRLSTSAERADVRNNIFYTPAAAGSTLGILDGAGQVFLSHNWIKTGWRRSFSSGGTVTVIDDGSSVIDASPGFVNERARKYIPTTTSLCVNAGTLLDSRTLPVHDVVMEYGFQNTVPRTSSGLLDIGAYEHR